MKPSCFLLASLWGTFAFAAAPRAEFAWTNDFAVLGVDRHGTVVQLEDRLGGRNLLKNPSALSSFVDEKGKPHHACAISSCGAGRYRVTFREATGAAVYALSAEKWGFLLKVESCDVKPADGSGIGKYRILLMWPAKELGTYVGATACACSDDSYALVMRAFDLETTMGANGTPILEARVDAPFSPVGQRVGLIASPRAQVRDRLKEMTLAAGALYTKCGGAWSLDAPENRRSYMFSAVTHDSVEDWIALAERGGFSTIHFSGWWKALGHYDPAPSRFPGGKEQLKADVARVKAAGLEASTHTLCSGIAFSDPWITPVCNTNLMKLYSYTLAKPLTEHATELVVNEKPGPRHDRVTTYLSCGNIIQIGTELMTYTNFTATAPYTFTGLKRGAYGTKKIGLVPAGTPAHYLFQHFFTLFPDPKTDFGDEMAKTVCDMINYYGFCFGYQDGAEPFSRYDVDLNRYKFSKYLDQTRLNPQIEASTWNAHSWWYHSSCGAWDHPVFAPKRFHDLHIKAVVESVRKANFLAGQMGWWQPRMTSDFAHGHFPDDMEYFASKNAAYDLPMSIQGVNVTAGPAPLIQEEMVTILGWYERARLAKAFTDEALEIMRVPMGETRLRQDAAGRWQIQPVTLKAHRITSSSFRRWQAVAAADQPATLRVEALYAAEPYDSPLGRPLFNSDDIPSFQNATAGKDVTLALAAGTDPAHGKTLKITATNARAAKEGAWTRAALKYAFPFRNIAVKGTFGAAFGFWVKGDGSGAVLNLQLQTPAIYVGGWSDHLVTIDFTGWRYVQVFVRERDAAEYVNYKWPYGHALYALYRNRLNLERIEHVNVYLNNVPARGKTQIELGEVRVLPAKENTFTDAAVTVGETTYKLPFPLVSGDWAELEEGFWVRRSAKGECLARAAAPREAVLKKGANACAFTASSADGDPRAEVSLFARGAAVGALREGFSDAKHLAYEAMRPQWFEPAKGFDSLKPIVARPGASALVELEIVGQVERPALTFAAAGGAKTVCTFPVTVKATEKLVCRDGKNWQILDAKRKVVAKGALPQAMPRLGPATATFSAAPASACRVNVVKRYRAAPAAARKATVTLALAAPDKPAIPAPAAPAARAANEPLAAWLFEDCGAPRAKAEGDKAGAIALSPAVKYVTGPFGTGLAFTTPQATAAVPVPAANGAWTATCWVRAAAENQAKAPWNLAGTVRAGATLKGEKWTLLAVEGAGALKPFALGGDGDKPFSGFVDDLRIYPRALSADAIEELAGDARHEEIEGYQDDGTGGVTPIQLFDQRK